MKAYLINLDRAPERLKHSTSQLEAVGLTVHRISAVDGRVTEFTSDDFDERAFTFRQGMRKSGGEIGCYLSHLRALGTFVASGEDYGLICEDDITVTGSSWRAVECALQHKEHFDILRLCGNHRALTLTVLPLAESYRLSVALTRQTGSGAYVITRRGAQRLLGNLRPMKVPYDHAYDRQWSLRILFLEPFPFGQKDCEFPSQINTSPVSRKYPPFQRYVTVFPYRAINETSRVLCRTWQYASLSWQIKGRPALQRHLARLQTLLTGKP